MPKISRPVKPLADVNVLPQADGSNKIVACFMPDPQVLSGEAESRAVLALDASRSIKSMFGGGPFGGGSNYVEMVGRKLGEILCDVTKSGKVSMLYWALGGGAETQVIGELDGAGCASVAIGGPPANMWGRGTHMLPVIKYIVEDVGESSEWTIGVIITDGIIEDEQACMDYCLQVGRELDEGKRSPIKLVLIGVGDELDKDQLDRFDDMFEDTPLADKVDLFSSGVAASMQEEADIVGTVFGEIMDEEMIVADSGRILDGAGRQIASFPDGLPGKFSFTLPKGATSFTVHTLHGEVVQDVSEAL